MQPQPDRRSLWSLLAPQASTPQRHIADPNCQILIRDLADGTTLEEPLEEFRGRSVMLVAKRQLPVALAAAQLDGIVRRLMLCTPDLSSSATLACLGQAEIDTVVTDGTGPVPNIPRPIRLTRCRDTLRPAETRIERQTETEWILLTSGTTGNPKLAAHTLKGLTGPIHDGVAEATRAVWSTFYDIRRYGGLQILLRALGGGASMVLSDAEETVGDFLDRVSANRVTHISGTPSHWRRALMSPRARAIAPDYVRLSGEACDQAILDALRQAYPLANIAHAFASTEAGVAFDVRDGQAGFPASLIGNNTQVEMRVVDGSLRIRSGRMATRYLGAASRPLSDADGFVDTGDLVEHRGDRYYFIGRREGIINVGGLKVHPEAVESVINQHPAVHMSRVWARPNPITGAIVVADIVLNGSSKIATGGFLKIQDEIQALCRDRLASHQVPVIFRQVPVLEIAASGKLVRRHA